MAPPTPDDDELRDDDVGEDAPADDPAKPTRRRLVPMLVLIGGVIAAAPLLDGVGDRREVVIRLDEPSRVTEIAVLLRDGDTALWGTERRFDAGSAPARLSRTLPLPVGRYDLRVSLVESGQPRTIERHFDVVDDTSEVVIPIRPSAP